MSVFANHLAKERDVSAFYLDSVFDIDTLYIGCEKFPQHVFYPISVGGVR